MKNSPRLSGVVALLFVAIIPGLMGRAVPSRESLCRVEDVTLLSNGLDQVLDVSSLSFASAGDTWGGITLRNQGSLAISEVTVLIEYSDDRGRRLLAIPYGGITEGGATSSEQLLHLANVDKLPSPIPPGEVVRLQGNNALTTEVCPTQAKMTYINIRYIDQSNYTWASPGWRSDPLFRDSPEYFEGGKQLIRLPEYLSIMVRINASGEVDDTTMDDGIDQQLASLIRRYVGAWTYYPALVDGKPRERQLTLLVRFHEPSQMWSLVGVKQMVSPFIIVDIVPYDIAEGHWDVWYGQIPASRILHRKIPDGSY